MTESNKRESTSAGVFCIMMVIPRLESGGAERQMRYLVRGLAKHSYKVVIVTLSEKEAFSTDKSINIRHFRLSGRNNYDPRLFLQLNRLIRRLRPDIIQTWNPQTDILGGVAAILNSRRWIIREPNNADPYRSGWQAKLRAWLGAKAAAIVSNSSGGDEYWRSLYPDQRRFIISNGIPLSAINRVEPATRQKLDIGADRKTILCVGRLTRQKRVDRVITALADLDPEEDADLIICGEGEELGELKRMARELGIEARVFFRGFLKAETVWALMKSADLFVNLSDFEGMPNTVMEAMVCGSPLLVSDIPAHREFLDITTACLVSPGDREETGKQISFLLSPRAAEGNRARAMAARGKISSWSIADMVRQYEDIYQEVLSGHS